MANQNCNTVTDFYLRKLQELTTQGTTTAMKHQTPSAVAAAVARIPGSVITYRSFKSSCSRSMRGISSNTFWMALENLKDVGETMSIRIGSLNRPSIVFIKRDPEDIDWDHFKLLTREVYTAAYLKKCPSSVTWNMRRALVEAGTCKESILTE